MTGVSWHRPVGAVFLALAVMFFVVMVYGIVAWHPLYALTVFVWLGLAASGFLLIFRPPSRTVRPKEVRGAMDDPIVPETKDGFGEGYCPKCGAPLTEGDRFCGVCGRRLRWTGEGSGGSSSASPSRRWR